MVVHWVEKSVVHLVGKLVSWSAVGRADQTVVMKVDLWGLKNITTKI